MGPATSGKSITVGRYESCRWGYCRRDDYVGDQTIKNETAIKEVIEIVIGDQVYDRDQVGVGHDKWSQSERYVPRHVTRDQERSRDQGGDRDRDR